jgi:hypothetical protein
MARVTATEVKDILSNCTLETHVIDTFITAGNQLVTRVFAGSSVFSVAELKEIERWFVAHMIASTLTRTTSDEKLGDASVTYTGKWGTNLDSTNYGQMVKQLDSTGLMTSIGKQKASITAVKEFEE